jgi:hypothetical protein
MGWASGTKTLWTVVNERDGLAAQTQNSSLVNGCNKLLKLDIKFIRIFQVA